MNEMQINTVGNLTNDPDLTYTPQGQAVVKFRIAITPRIRKDSEWIDGETTYLACAAWGDLAEHLAESVTRGTRLLVSGVLRTERWKGQDGEDREALRLRVDEAGLSLKFATAQVRKVDRLSPGLPSRTIATY